MNIKLNNTNQFNPSFALQTRITDNTILCTGMLSHLFPGHSISQRDQEQYEVVNF